MQFEIIILSYHFRKPNPNPKSSKFKIRPKSWLKPNQSEVRLPDGLAVRPNYHQEDALHFISKYRIRLLALPRSWLGQKKIIPDWCIPIGNFISFWDALDVSAESVPVLKPTHALNQSQSRPKTYKSAQGQSRRYGLGQV